MSEKESETKAPETKAPEAKAPEAKADTTAAAPEPPREIPDALLKRVQRPKVGDDGRVETTVKKRREGGETIEERVPVLRAVERGEVLAWAESDDEVVVVTTDGQKYSAPKKGA